MSTECSGELFSFQAAGGRQVVARFDGGNMSSDAGVLLLAKVDRRAGILREFGRCFTDHRDPTRTEHTLEQLLAQRIYGIALGYEDLNDHDELRKDPLLAVVAGSKDPLGTDRARPRDAGKALAGKSTLNRLELSESESAHWDRYKKIAADALEIDRFMVAMFIRSEKRAPKQVILDLDTTDDPVHGMQEGRFFHGHYGHYCFLPLYVFAGEHILLSKLLPGNADAKKAVLPELERIVGRIRGEWPNVQIIVRGDSGFMSDEIMKYCEGNRVDYVLGVAKNSRLLKRMQRPMRKAARLYRKGKKKKAVRVFQDIYYKTRRSWSRRRRVVAKAEHMEGGANPRFVVTSIKRTKRSARWIYEDLYCKRGDMENRIKEQQMDMFADRTSTETMVGNQLRLYFSSVAYMLMHALRGLALAGTDMARAQCATIRIRLLKIAAQVRVTVRKVWVSMPTGCPYAEIFAKAHAALQRC